MNKLLSSAVLAAACSAGSAQALESFSVPYSGVARIPIDCHLQPLCGIFDFPWISVVTVQTVSGADGVYRFDSYPRDNPANTLTFMSLVSGGSVAWPFDLSTRDAHLLGGVTATLQGGRLVSMDGSIVGEFIATWRFAGETLSFDLCCAPHSGQFSGHAAMIPEPATYALMLGGLAAGWLARRRLGRRDPART